MFLFFVCFHFKADYLINYLMQHKKSIYFITFVGFDIYIITENFNNIPKSYVMFKKVYRWEKKILINFFKNPEF